MSKGEYTRSCPMNSLNETKTMIFVCLYVFGVSKGSRYRFYLVWADYILHYHSFHNFQIISCPVLHDALSCRCVWQRILFLLTVGAFLAFSDHFWYNTLSRLDYKRPDRNAAHA